MAKWIAFFSQTGNEIAEVSKQVGRWPDLIITNERPPHLRSINRDVLSHNIITLPNKPSVEDYRRVLSEELYGKDYVISLHGWLRIMPTEIIKEYPVMYNGHPGLINKYPELKGKDPQQKALDLKLPSTGTIIHKVTKEVDSGEIILYNTLKIMEQDTIVTLSNALRSLSISLWIEFLKERFVETV